MAQAAGQRAAQEQQAAAAKQPPSLLQQWTAPVEHVGLNMIDSAVSTADAMYNTQPIRKARDVAAGAITGAVNIADAGHSLVRATEQNFADLANQESIPGHRGPANVMNAPSPIWDHAKNAVLGFRDAVAVQDPTLADNLIQGVSQLAIPFTGYSRMIGGLGMVAKGFAAGALTDATALGPHDPRLADLVALGRHTEGKLGDALRTLAPDGSAVNAYINFLTDRSGETEAEGRFKNVLDGFGANLIATPLIHGAAVVLKQGTAGLRAALEGGASKVSDLMSLGPVDPGTEAPLDPDSKIVSKTTADQIPDAGLTLEGETPKPSAQVAALPSDGTALHTPNTAADHSGALADVRQQLAEVQATGQDQPISKVISQIANNVDWKASPDNLHFKKLFTQLKSLNLPTELTTPTEGYHAERKNVYGTYHGDSDTIAIHSAAQQGDDQVLMHTIAHEAVHAATMKALSEPENALVARGVKSLMQDAAQTKSVQALSAQDRYAFQDGKPAEFVAEALANPRLNAALKSEGLLPEVEGYVMRLMRPAAGAAVVGGITAEDWKDPKFRKFFTDILTPREPPRA